jgi:uncharacterized membrane protein YoaK (UPF0700 family)
MDLVKNKNHAVNLNFMVGTLSLSSQGSVEFTSGKASSDAMSTYTSMIPADLKSNVSEIERSVRGMQNDQQSTAHNRAANNSAVQNNIANRPTGGSAFITKKKWLKDMRVSAE